MRELDRWWRGALCAFGVLSLSSMAGMSLGAGFFLLVSLLVYGRAPEKRRKELWTGAFARTTLALFFVSFLSLLAAAWFPPLGEPAGGFGELKKFHHFLYPFFFAAAFLGSGVRMEEHSFWKWWTGMGLLSASLAVLQFWGGSLFPEAWLESRFFRAVGTTGRFHGQGLMFFHLSFASCMSFVGAAGLARVLWPRDKDSRRVRLYWLMVAVAGFLAVFYSYSRIAWVAIPVTIVGLGFLKRPRLGIVSLLIVAIFGAGAWFTSESLRKRIVDSQAHNHHRYDLWLGSLEAAKERPLTGVGFARTGRYAGTFVERAIGKKAEFTSHSHNNFLDALAATGWLGFLVFTLWWGIVIFMAWKAFRLAPERERWLPAACLGGFLSFHVNGLTQVNFWDGKSQHTLMLWVGVALALYTRAKSRASQ